MVTTLIIILALALIAAVVWCLFKSSGIAIVEEKETDLSNNVATATGWRLKVVGTGQIVNINGKDTEIKNIILAYDGVPEWKYTYFARVRYKFVGGETEKEYDGTVSLKDKLTINGVNYYGVILAGAPDVEIINSNIQVEFK